jgi:hypothetical protein
LFGNRRIATRPPADRWTNRLNRVRRDNGTRLSATIGPSQLNPTTMPTWLVHVPVASAIWVKGGVPMRVKTMSPTRKSLSSSVIGFMDEALQTPDDGTTAAGGVACG